MREVFPKFEIRKDQLVFPCDLSKLYDMPVECVCLEIGFGAGEHLALQVITHPERLYIGCEPFMNGVAALMDVIDKEHITNIRVYPDEVRELLVALPDLVLDEVYILFPDPWPKTRHHKRRLINQHTLDMVARVHKSGGRLLIASDHHDYASWILEHLMVHGAYEWTAKSKADWLTPPEVWVNTRYEDKALASSMPVFIECIKK